MTERSPRNLFTEEDDSAAILRKWWKGLRTDSKERDRIRGCGDPLRIMLSPEYQRLLDLLKEAGYNLDAEHSYAVAAVVGVVAQVTADTGPGESFARQMAEPAPGSKRARVSGLRLDRLVGQQQREIAYLLLMPVMELLSGTVNLADMARGLYRWDNVARQRWADEYYGVVPTGAVYRAETHCYE
jgi:CRISPR type I-E-associated protein CasB/Cse2